MNEINIFSWDFVNITIQYFLTAEEMYTARIFLLIALIIIPIGIMGNIKRKISIAKKIIDDNKPVEDIKGRHGTLYKELDACSQKHLIKQGLLLTMPISFGLVIPFMMIIFSFGEILTGNIMQFFKNILGVAGMLIVIYVCCNCIQSWFLHQLIMNKCRVSIEQVENITENTSKTLWIKDYITGFHHRPTIQYIDTGYDTNIPTLYRSVDKNIIVGSEVFVIEMTNGKKYVLEGLENTKDTF